MMFQYLIFFFLKDNLMATVSNNVIIELSLLAASENFLLGY